MLSVTMPSLGSLFKCVLHLSFIAVFVFCAHVQLNDPDKEVWIAIYSAPAIVALINLLRESILPQTPVFSNVALGTMGYAAYMAYQILPSVLNAYEKDKDVWKLLLGDNQEFSMKPNDLALEEARELGGLCIVIFYCLLTLLMPKKTLKEHPN